MEPDSPWRRLVLLENVPRQLAGELPHHDVSTVGKEEWRGVLNGALLRRAELAGFEVFVTGDRNLEYQQTLAGRSFGVVVVFPRRLKMGSISVRSSPRCVMRWWRWSRVWWSTCARSPDSTRDRR